MSIILFSCESIQEEMHTLKDDTLRVSSNILIESNGDSTHYMHERTESQNVFISVLPSDRWIDSMQQMMSEDDWDIIVDDNEHYRYQTGQYLESKGYIELLRPKDGIWVIKRPSCSSNVFNFDTLENKWGVIIFSGNEEPFIYEGTTPEIDLKAY